MRTMVRRATDARSGVTFVLTLPDTRPQRKPKKGLRTFPARISVSMTAGMRAATEQACREAERQGSKIPMTEVGRRALALVLTQKEKPQ